jgi:hypothetical protein
MGHLKFFYATTLKRDWEGFRVPKGRGGRRLPIVLSQQEVEALFGAIKNLKHRAILMTIYSAGLRISEALHLKLTDIDSQRMTIRIEHGKGNKDRYTLLGKRNWIFYGSTGRSIDPRTGCSVILLARGLFQQTLSGGSFIKLFVRRGLRNPQSYTPYGTVLPPICWRQGPTFIIFSICWAIPIPERRLFIFI